jgi:hypothetical protein
MTWDPITQPVDYILLANKRSPGFADVSGATSPRKYDELKGHGQSGATLVFLGIAPAKFTVKLRLYTVQDWADWDAWRPLVDKAPGGKKPTALDIWHPHLVPLGIKSVVVESISQPEQTGEGEWTIEIVFLPYIEPTPARAKPKGSKASAAAPVDPVDQEIEGLTKQFQDLAAQ